MVRMVSCGLFIVIVFIKYKLPQAFWEHLVGPEYRLKFLPVIPIAVHKGQLVH